MKNNGKIALSLAAVFAAGALAGVLFAPAKGERTRKRIMRKGKHLVDSIEEVIQDGKNSVTDIREHIKDKVETFKEEFEQFSKC